MGRTMSLRGVLNPASRKRIMMFDSGVNNKGWIIKDFWIQNQDSATPTHYACGILSSADVQYSFKDWDPNQVIAIKEISATNSSNMIIDPNHVVVSDLYLCNVDTRNVMNYSIWLEEIDVDPAEYVIYRIKEEAQNTD